MKQKLPLDIPLISFHSEASTVTQIVHAELPCLPQPKSYTVESDTFLMIPISADMAVCSLHLRLRYGEKSVVFVTCRETLVNNSLFNHL